MLLEEEDQTLDQIASHAGFGNAERMRRSFARQLHVVPDQYRRHFEAAGERGGHLVPDHMGLRVAVKEQERRAASAADQEELAAGTVHPESLEAAADWRSANFHAAGYRRCLT